MRIDDIDKEFQELADSLRSGEEAYQRGDMQQAEELLEQAYDIIAGFGDEHPDADACLSRLADVYYQRQRYAEATQLLLDLYQLRAKQVSTRHPSFVQLLFRTAKCYERAGQFLEAEYVYLQCLGLLNVTGMPDRAAAAAIAESFAKMLRGLDGRMEEAEDLEEQARDLRNLTREKLNLEIIKRMDFDDVEIVDIDEGSQGGGRRGIGSLRRRAGNIDLEPRPGMTLKIILVSVLGLLLVAGIGAFLAWRVVTAEEAKKKKAAAASVGPIIIKPRSQTFKTLDGLEQLILFDNGDGTFVSGGETIKGKAEETGGILHLKVKGKGKKEKLKDLEFPATDAGYGDENNVTMYNEQAREWSVVASMRRIAKDAEASYHVNGGSYLGSVPTYSNAVNGKQEAALIKNIGSMDRNVNFEKLEHYEHEVQDVLTWSKWSTGRPGAVELYHYASAEDGDTLYVKGTDEKGVYLRGANPQAAYVLKLVNGDPK